MLWGMLRWGCTGGHMALTPAGALDTGTRLQCIWTVGAQAVQPLAAGRQFRCGV